MYMYMHVHFVMYLYVHGINISVPCSDTYVLFLPILSRWVGFQMPSSGSEAKAANLKAAKAVATVWCLHPCRGIPQGL